MDLSKPFFEEGSKAYAKSYGKDEQTGKPRRVWAIKFGHGYYPPLLSIRSVGSLVFLYFYMSFEITYVVSVSFLVCLSVCERGMQEMLRRVIEMSRA